MSYYLQKIKVLSVFVHKADRYFSRQVELQVLEQAGTIKISSS